MKNLLAAISVIIFAVPALAQTSIYDFSTCPGLSSVPSYGNVVVSKDDQTISAESGDGNYLAVYSRLYGKCYWFDAKAGEIGGTDNPTPVSVTVPQWPSGYGYHDANILPSGQYGWVVPSNGASINVFWTVYDSNGNETTTLKACTATSGACDGHISFGYSNAVYVASNPSTGGVPGHYDFGITPLAAPTTYTHLLPHGPPYYNAYSQPECNVTDTHTNWTSVNSGDSNPFLVTSFVDGSNSPYSFMQIHCAFDHEIDAVATDGSGTVWRLAHNRATGKINYQAAFGYSSGYNAYSMPVSSPDGKYFLFATDWANASGYGSLGTQTGEISSSFYCYGNYGCKWNSSTGYAHYQEVIDSNGNEEMVTVAGTSGTTQPTWPTTAGGTVTDGTVTWQMGAGCNTSATTSTTGVCRTDVFIVEVK